MSYFRLYLLEPVFGPRKLIRSFPAFRTGETVSMVIHGHPQVADVQVADPQVADFQILDFQIADPQIADPRTNIGMNQNIEIMREI